MAMATSTLERAREFLAHRRIAVVGLSRDPRDFSRGVFRELARRGYDVVPVNPALAQAEGRPCRAGVKEIDPPPDAALLFTPPAEAERVVRECLEAGVRRVWMHRGAGRGAASPAAIELCRAAGVEPVTDLCPFMALPDAGLGHRIHAWFRRRSLERRERG
jgi:predicted CoA-binding protein